MTECDVCGIDTDIEGWFTFDNGIASMSEEIKLCGYCKDKVKDFIERDLLRT